MEEWLAEVSSTETILGLLAALVVGGLTVWLGEHKAARVALASTFVAIVFAVGVRCGKCPVADLPDPLLPIAQGEGSEPLAHAQVGFPFTEAAAHGFTGEDFEAARKMGRWSFEGGEFQWVDAAVVQMKETPTGLWLIEGNRIRRSEDGGTPYQTIYPPRTIPSPPE